MKYRNIFLKSNGNIFDDVRFSQLRLLKYNKKYEPYLDRLREVNNNLANSVEIDPSVFGDDSVFQSYMIFDYTGSEALGMVSFWAPLEEKDMEITLKVDENVVSNKNYIYLIVEQIVELLGVYYYDKENLEINLLNDLDLSKYNSYRYKKNVYSKMYVTYSYANKMNNILIPRLLSEIKVTEKNLINLHECWMEKINFDGLHYLVDEELIKEIEEKKNIPLEEILYKLKSIDWTGIKSNKATRAIRFEKNGKVCLKRVANDLGKINYEVSYNVLHGGFVFTKEKMRNISYQEKEFEIDYNKYATNIKSKNLKFNDYKENGLRKINYVSEIRDKSSCALDLFIGMNGEIKKCYLDFRTHKANGKINGVYALRIIPGKKYNFDFVSRKGKKMDVFTGAHTDGMRELFLEEFGEYITINDIDEIISKIIFIINSRAVIFNTQMISLEHEMTIQNLKEAYEEIIMFIKQIFGEIPLPSLQDNMRRFINEYDINKKKVQAKVLKK